MSFWEKAQVFILIVMYIIGFIIYIHNRFVKEDITYREKKLNEKEQDIEKKLNEKEQDIEKEIVARSEKAKREQIHRILNDAANRPYLKNTSVYAEICAADNIFENERFYKATTEKMAVASSIRAEADIVSKDHTYKTTLESCTCPDFQNRKLPCKHMYRLAIDLGLLSSFRASYLLKDYREKADQIHHDIDEWQKASQRYEKNQKLLRAIGKIRTDSLEKSSELVARLTADYLDIEDQMYTRHLELKSNPALKTAQKMKLLRQEKKEAIKRAKICEYQIQQYESLFPWLTEYRSITPQDAKSIAEEELNPNQESFWYKIPSAKYNQLTSAEKTQLALDRYVKRKKTSWEVGIEYERYVGYLFETNGYRVKYSGALLKLEDMGRDLIAKKGNQVLVIQCKRWAQEKVIHEKHIFQLYGTSILLAKQFPEHKITPVFCTTTELSDTAKYCAEKMGVVLREKLLYEEYPLIKCNVSKSGERIYHLPFDQQYDRINMDEETNKLYVHTVAEAERLGFRHAHKWIQNKEV